MLKIQSSLLTKGLYFKMKSSPPTWNGLWKQLRGAPPEDTATPAAFPELSEKTLEAIYAESPLRHEPDTFVLYRIIGNDLPPRHRRGQSITNLRFLLENEPALPGCEKRWVINRITDPATEAALLDLLRDHHQPVLHIPFIAEDYARIPLDLACLPSPKYLSSFRFRWLRQRQKDPILGAVNRLKNLYVMNNNGARNAALADGRSRAKWVLPFDGNCFFTASAWDKLAAGVTARPWLKYFTVPMARLLDNNHLFDSSFTPEAKEEPQLLFRRDAAEMFNEAFPYGRRPKVELFWRLGIAGRWDAWTDAFWDQPRRPLSPEAHQFGSAGWVARLFSGVPELEAHPLGFTRNRALARQEAILTLLKELDTACGAASSANRTDIKSSQPHRLP